MVVEAYILPKLFVPQRVNPRRGKACQVRSDALARTVSTSESIPGLRLGDVGMAVECDDGRRLGGGMRREEQVQRESRDALTLEGADPVRWPPVDLAGVKHRPRLEFLRAFCEQVPIRGILLLAHEEFVHGVGGAGLKAETGGIADGRRLAENALVELYPDADNTEYTRMGVKEPVQRHC